MRVTVIMVNDSPSQPRLTRLHLEALIVPARRTLPRRHSRMEKRIIAVPLQMWSTLTQIRQAASRTHNPVTLPYQLGSVCGGRPHPFPKASSKAESV